MHKIDKWADPQWSMFQWGGSGAETEKQVNDTERQKVFVKQGTRVGNVGGKQ